MTRILAHISDLHVGRDRSTDAAARQLCADLVAASVDEVLLTGDVTERGRRAELLRFHEIFAPLLSDGRVVVVPGNHDRMGDDAAASLMGGRRVEVCRRPGLFIVRLDSTAPHNRSLIHSHGELSERDIDEVDAALAMAPTGAVVIVMLHHHLLPLREDFFSERLSTLLGWPNAAELRLGARLLDRVRGRCDLVLHGHRHSPSEMHLATSRRRPLRVYNAGSSTDLGRTRLVQHAAGKILEEAWLPLGASVRPFASGAAQAAQAVA